MSTKTNTLARLREPKTIRRTGAGLLILAAFGGIFYYESVRARVSIPNSLIQAPIVSVTAPAPGTLKQVLVNPGDKVAAGDALAVVDSTVLRAEDDGLIMAVNKQIGGTVGPQTAIVQMINPVNMRVDGTLDENKGLYKIKAGQTVSFTVDALPGKKYWGLVDEVSPTAKATQLAFDISNQRPTQQFDVYVNFDAFAYPEIKNGMSAKMTVYTEMPK